ncbi:hypothetical protein EJ03DRAFT_354618 [Teratosphaeria nubilosa]|uniref:DUF2235 domain-containing protein n=1 Tax=Teratosphaeria nubilosa TaxID=161662 RepID=A0A6G1KYN6_9PEZI|nr:hypothetical protein EJ03DRAFT_354618 [Teratosphaeria nubilosa]
MSADQENLPTRLVLCVDGTTKSSGSQTNVHRIYSGVQLGKVIDSSSGIAYKQVPRYVSGIGSADEIFSADKLQAFVFGQGFLKQIQDVYELCCQLNGPQDELFLFGYSRGAYVVRAVAGLLHAFGAIASAGQSDFENNFKKLLKEAENRHGTSELSLSPTSSIGAGTFRPAPKIKFVGVFDTVKAASNSSLIDIGLNGSIQNMRHALALNEDRKALTPEAIYPDEFYRTDLRTTNRTFVQAWFIGTHADMGGSAKKAGLGLYPLQWMLVEAMKYGLVVDFGPSRGDLITNPLSVVCPSFDDLGRKIEPWSCSTVNGIVFTLYDLRAVHDAMQFKEAYAVKLGSRFGSIRQKKTRNPFADNGSLLGFCFDCPQGTVLHPSVYLLLDEHSNVALEMKELKLQRYIEDWREKMLGSKDGVVNHGFWLDEDDDDNLDLGAIRVLVCGNTGVGKSTLVNKTFGVPVTQSSNRTRGIHDVKQEITFEGRPDLVVHDSGGFEAGADEEFVAIEQFLKDKSATLEVAARLHVIWFCVDINSPRTLQTATEKLFRSVSLYASDVPIIVVATKKDDFVDLQFSARRKAMKKAGEKFDEEACEQFAEEQLQQRLELLRQEMLSVPDGRLDACVAVSQEDEASIADLSKTTSHCFGTDKVRHLYIRAQVTRIDLKIDLALCEITKRYKRLVRDATGASYAPMGATITRKVSTNKITKSIINCFGLPTVSAETAIEALTANVWKTFGANVTLALAEAFHLIVGLGASGATSGMPTWLITGSINATYVVPATCRLFLVMAADLTLVLARSFKEVAFRQGGMPTARDVSAAARNYRFRGYSQHVHEEVKLLVPKKNVMKSFRADQVRQGLEAIVVKYKDKLMEDVDLPLKIEGRPSIGELSADDDTSKGVVAELLGDLKNGMKELEAGPALKELEGSQTTVAELPGDVGARAELAHSASTVKKRFSTGKPGPLELSTSPSTAKKPARCELEG